jgi:CHAT domain-containing protein/tetratricopeptide (TPR) repeat protein
MIPKYIRKFCILLIFSTTACLLNASAHVNLSSPCYKSPEYIISITDLQKQPDSMQLINARVASFYATRNFQGLLYIADSLDKSLAVNYPDSITLSEIYYHIGVSLLLADKYNDALRWLNLCVKVKEDLGIVDNHYANGIFNIGVAYNYLGDFFRVTDYMHRYIEISTGLYGYYSEEVAGAYTTLVSASLEKHEYDNVRDYAKKTLEILNVNKNALQGSELCRFYINVGVWYARLSDYAKARIYLEEAESIYNNYNIPKDQSYINLINSLAITYGSLGFTVKEKEYFDRGIELAVYSNSSIAYNLIYNYAVELGHSGMIKMGEELIFGLVDKSGKVFGYDSRLYIEALKNYADYLRDYKHDYQNSIRYYLPCLDYLNQHNEEVVLRDPVIAGYALSLSRSGEHIKALEKIQELLFYNVDSGANHDKYKNPDISKLKADSRTLGILKYKYEILWKIFTDSDDQVVLENAAMTSELIISLLDKIRINISEDESRIILGDNYRDSYLFAIRDFELCYRNTGNNRFLAKVFEFAEKSKAAGLLAATRELNAVNFHIPSDISELEKSLQRDIAFYNSQISKENEKEMPDKRLISEWNDRLLKAVEVRDSLLLTYERDYPGYYAIKYGTDVLSMKNVPGIAGRNTNYLNYVVSDSLLYIFLVNRKYKQILTSEIDSSFFRKLSDFRTLLSNSDLSANARRKFDYYQKVGYDLYKILIEPVRQYFISDELLISPDNILSYVPFETFLSSYYNGEGIVYRRLPYLMNEFSISYTYSVSFMKETVGRDYRKARNLIAFAPLYTKGIYIDSLSAKRQSGSEILYDLPYARMEAEYVTDISKGTVYINENARESVFKTEAGKYDIVHLAMHTYLNDQNPMASAMIFTQTNDLPEDGLLNTYEVYGIPLKARMVVLSSCNTGTGMLSSGEGILSLARGFLYSGSQSVVMSMWEIEDQSGTDIVKMFYDNLLRGKSKSKALKNARTEYLKTASQLKSHPYFWSSLIVYGVNSPIYHRRTLISVIVCSFCIIVLVFYFMYRKYS